jgi:hypothetical protein
MIRLTKHAQEAIDKREIAMAWVERAIVAPDFARADPRRPAVNRSYKSISEAGGRILRVAHSPDGDDILVITVHFDRNARP